MSEHLQHAPKHESLPANDNNEALSKHLDSLREKAEADSEAHNDNEVLESIKQSVDKTAVSKEDYNTSESAADNAPAATYVSRELKEMGFRRNLNNARRQMSTPARAISKAIHQPVVEKISEVAGPTVARPSGILGGGLFAFAGSAVLLYLTKHYGYRYNYLVFILLFVGGFVAGMFVELIVRALFKRGKNSS